MGTIKGVSLNDVNVAIELLKKEGKKITRASIADVLGTTPSSVIRPYTTWREQNGYRIRQVKKRKSMLDVKPISSTNGLREMIKAFLLTKEGIELVKEVYSVSTIEVIKLPEIKE